MRYLGRKVQPIARPQNNLLAADADPHLSADHPTDLRVDVRMVAIEVTRQHIEPGRREPFLLQARANLIDGDLACVRRPTGDGVSIHQKL